MAPSKKKKTPAAKADAVPKQATLKELTNMPLSMLVKFYNQFQPKDKQVKRFKDKKSAIRRVTGLASAGTITTKKEKNKNKAPLSRNVDGTARKKREEINLMAKVTLLPAAKPVRKGEANARYALLKDGMLVKTALKKGVLRRDFLYWAKAGRLRLG